MKIKIVYSKLNGKYLDFEATSARDKKDLAEFRDNLTSAGYQFSSLSVMGKMQNIKLPVELKR